MVPVGLNWPGGPGGPELQLTDFAASWLEHNRFEINSEVAYPFNLKRCRLLGRFFFGEMMFALSNFLSNENKVFHTKAEMFSQLSTP